MKLNDRVSVVTGAARGIGKAIAERYAKEGARVVVADLNEQGAKAVASELGPNAIGLKLDVTNQASIDGMVADTFSRSSAASTSSLTTLDYLTSLPSSRSLANATVVSMR
jgi:3-oxoacyl-[acyl-carrier protein] reductase